MLPPLAVSVGVLVLLLLANMPRGRRCVLLCDSDDGVARVRRWLAHSEEACGLSLEQRIDVVNTKTQFVCNSANFLAIAEPVPETQLADSAACALVHQLVDSHAVEHGLLPVLFSSGSVLDILGKEMCGAVCLGTPATPWTLAQVLLSDTELDALLQIKQDNAQQATVVTAARDTLLWDGPQALVQRMSPTAESGTALATLAQELDAGVVDDHRPLCDAVAAVLSASPPVLGSKALVVLPCADTAVRMLAQLRACPSTCRLSLGTWGACGCNCCCAAVHDVLAAGPCDALAAVSEVVLVAHPAGFVASREVFALNELLPPSAHRSVVAVRALAVHEQYREWWNQQGAATSSSVPLCVLEPRSPVFCTAALLDGEFGAELVRCGWRPVLWRPSSSSSALPVLVVGASHSLVVLHGNSLRAALAGTGPALPMGVSREWPLFTHCTVVVVAADPVQLAAAGVALQHAGGGLCLSLRFATRLQQAAALVSGLLARAPRAVLTRSERFWALLGADPLWVQTHARPPTSDSDPVADFVRRVAGFDCRGSKALAQLLRSRSATQTPAEPVCSKTDSVLDRIMYRATAAARAAPPERPLTLSCCLPRGASHGQTQLCWVRSPEPPLPAPTPAPPRVSVCDAVLQRISDFFSYKED